MTPEIGTANDVTETVATPAVEKPSVKKTAVKKTAKAKKPIAKKKKKTAKTAAKAKTSKKEKEGLPRGVGRVCAALAKLRKAATAEAIAEVMGIAKPAVLASLGSSASEDPTTAIGAGMVQAQAAGGPDAQEGERMLRYELTSAGKKLAEKAVEKAGSAKKAALRPMSQIQAAIEVLRTAKEAMNPAEIQAAIEKKGLWECPNGKTPAATLSAAIIRDAASEKPRFKKVSRGHYLLTALGAKS